MPKPESCRAPAGLLPARVGAIVLAAGYSSRMGRFKPLLPFAGATVIETTVRMFLAAGVEDTIVVLGHRAEELRPLAAATGARCVANPDFANGMFTSVRAAAGAVDERMDGYFLLPADMPLVRPSTIRALCGEFSARRNAVIHPVFAGRRGHPPLIARAVLTEAAQDSEGPLSVLLARHRDQAVDLHVADEAIHMDMDSPADYEAQLALASHRDLPSVPECEALLDLHCVPLAVVRHCRKVAEVARAVADAMSKRGFEFDLELLTAGALLHDIAKGQPDHAHAGAAILRLMDFEKVAKVVASHTELDEVGEKIGEAEIVFLADKLVRGESYVGLQEHFRSVHARFEGNEQAQEAVRRRLAMAMALQARVEAEAGSSLEGILSQSGESSAIEGGFGRQPA